MNIVSLSPTTDIKNRKPHTTSFIEAYNRNPNNLVCLSLASCIVRDISSSFNFSKESSCGYCRFSSCEGDPYTDVGIPVQLFCVQEMNGRVRGPRHPWGLAAGAETCSMCITFLVSTARFVTETDRPNVLPRRYECDGYCPLTDMGRLAYWAILIVDGHMVEAPGGSAVGGRSNHGRRTTPRKLEGRLEKDERMVSKSPRMARTQIS
eukprot:scaffold54613_cov42-Cyclotella_meneghiniana.AAC.1